MKERTRDRIKDGFGGLINNAAAMRGAKNGPLWLTIVMFFLSILLPVLPLFISAANTSGSAFIGNNSYGVERYVTAVAIELKNNNHEFILDENHEMTVNNIDYNAFITFDAGDETKVTSATPIASYTNSVTGQYEFMVYASNLSGDSKQARNLNKLVGETRYVVKSTTEKDAINDPEGTQYYRPTYAIVFKNTIYVVVYYQEKAVSASLGGNFSQIKPNDKCLETILTVTNKDGTAVEASLTNVEYCNGVLKNCKRFLNKTYDAIKWKNTFATSGIYLAIFVGLSLFMGLLMWIMTRGKNNPNNYFSLWLCMKIEARLALTPGILTLVIGLFLTQYASMIFILTMGLRVMWISMKELRPMQQQ